MLEGSLVLRRAFSQNGSLPHIDMCGANWIPRMCDQPSIVSPPSIAWQMPHRVEVDAFDDEAPCVPIDTLFDRLAEAHLESARSRRLLHTHQPSVSKYNAFTRVLRRLTNTNNAPSSGSSLRENYVAELPFTVRRRDGLIRQGCP